MTENEEMVLRFNVYVAPVENIKFKCQLLYKQHFICVGLLSSWFHLGLQDVLSEGHVAT